MTNLRKYFGFRYSNNRKMFSRNRIKRAPAVAREGCGGSGAPGAGLRGGRGRRLQDFPERRSGLFSEPSGAPLRGSFGQGPGQVSGHIFGHVRHVPGYISGYIFGTLFGTHPKRTGTGKRGGTMAAAHLRRGRRMKPAQTPLRQPIGSRQKRPAGPQPNNS